MSEDLKSCQICSESFEPIGNPNNYVVCAHIIENTCLECLDNWVQVGIEKSSVVNQTQQQILCPIDTCRNAIIVENILRDIKPYRLPKTNDQLFYNHCRLSSDIVSCPNPTCNYRGIIKNQGCSSPLVCDKCQHEWHEPQQLQFWKKLRNFKEFKSNIYKHFYTKSCPTCQAQIQKNGGCNNMTCWKCSAHFCWLCCNLTNKHPLSCGIRVFVKSFFVFSPFFLYFKKIGFFKMAKDYQVIKPSERWYHYLLFPFKCFGVGVKIAGYYSFCASSLFFLYNGGLLLNNMYTGVKNKLKRLFKRNYNSIDDDEQPLNLYRKNNVQLGFLLSAGVLTATGLFSYYFGNKTEYKIFIGTNSLYLLLILSIFVGSSFSL